ncbi:tetraacyldisaccharide 4'-kinase [Flavobacterium capsici]|uniref:Tetraacyldisaccharide 4'-kinase n=1 Tax=Flavobacterium capsici TaxID=3075618 RepID=A0AA96F4H2_9FLAO|nr:MULTISPECIES: tetraacyldisaccharide 4'-kinase [unclassified Flavobacterium]WNM18571.1 tetraacyldisaccharide 4'-kinase [Flavobacterium sp. PMR2A8]WNM22622.1 tetraacyldisaccharide 4'-kinase [Flavobacterium sp. PMTSA4]
MIILRKLLFPFTILYGIVTSIRNFLYDKSIFKSYSFSVPIIAVGNLSVGGTGKTPQIEYLIRLLQDDYNVAVLSRGYKRKSEGFVLADKNSSAEILGDEPFQIHQKFPKINVAVDADRKNGIENLLSFNEKPEVILLDDAFQHRRVKAGFNILLTAYDDLFCDDFILPMGNLRESRSGAKRANLIVVTKCPNSISEDEKERITKKLVANKKVYFSTIEYDDFVYGKDKSLAISEVKPKEKLLLAGIAKPDLFFDYLKQSNDETMVFPDHHHFTENDIKTIENKTKNQLIITTEKDYVRLANHTLQSDIYYLPIKSKFLSDADDFNKTIKKYVGTSTRNR